jgi:hypothetical protein
MNANPSDTVSRNDACDALMRTGMSSLNVLVRSMVDLARAGMELNPVLAGLSTVRRRSCEIPPPCWLPRSLGEIHSLVCPGGTAVLHLRVTNCQARTSRVQAAFGKPDATATVTPSELQLGPMERGSFNAKIALPDDACKGQKNEYLLWVRGCNAHYLRWVVEAAGGVASSCHEIEIDDCPDLVHHWYDHFYCDRPCSEHGTSPNEPRG